MKFRTETLTLIAMAACAAALIGCGSEPNDEARCPGELLAYAESSWCVVIEEGFLTSDCPDEYPAGRDFDGAVVCGESEAPDEMRETLEEEGYLPTTCEDDPERGVVYVSHDGPDCALSEIVCPEGDVAFSDTCGCGCVYAGECEDGTTMEPDECNSCSCVDGAWQCTTAACVECDEGDTMTDDCNTCSCNGGRWECTMMECGVCTEGDTRDAGDGCNTCTCSGGEWLCTRLACECEEGETMEPDACNSCVCADGEWACTDAVCAECEEGETRVDGCEECTCSGGEWLCSADTFCDYDACMDACPTACEAEGDRPCGDNLAYFCNECQMACAGVTEIDAAACEDPASTCVGDVPPDSEPLEYEAWTMPELCPMDGTWDFEMPLQVYRDEEALQGVFPCVAESGGSEIDWDTHMLVRAIFVERTEAEVVYVHDRGGEIHIRLAAEAYCGGAAPPNAPVHVLIPASTEGTFAASECTYGRCVGPPAP